METSESVEIARRLDQHHTPETNGRMSVCRRCGARTDSPEGAHHVLQESQMSRSTEWLTAQSRLRDIEQARMMRAR
jgi:hypothetical protein